MKCSKMAQFATLQKKNSECNQLSEKNATGSSALALFFSLYLFIFICIYAKKKREIFMTKIYQKEIEKKEANKKKKNYLVNIYCQTLSKQ